MEVDEWFRVEIVTGLQKLLALRLQGTPPEDAIVGTAAVWLEALWRGHAWTEHLDRERIRQAFRVLLRICDHWPTPKIFLDNLGSRPQPPALPSPPMSPEEIARNKAKLRNIMEIFTKEKGFEHGYKIESQGHAVGVSEQGTDAGSDTRPRRRAARTDAAGDHNQ